MAAGMSRSIHRGRSSRNSMFATVEIPPFKKYQCGQKHGGEGKQGVGHLLAVPLDVKGVGVIDGLPAVGLVLRRRNVDEEGSGE